MERNNLLIKRAITDRDMYLTIYSCHFRAAKKRKETILMAHWIDRIYKEFEFGEIPEDIKPYIENCVKGS